MTLASFTASDAFAYWNALGLKAGNNWFYTVNTGYEPGAGVGTLDVDNFARAMLQLGY